MHLFPYRLKNSHHPMTHSKFLKTIEWASKSVGLSPLKGHGLHISSTLKYLLYNIPFDIVKVKGYWASDTFLVYLYRQAQILTPYYTCKPSHPSKRLSSVTPSLLSTDNSLVSHVHLLPDGFIVSLFVSLPAPSGLGLQLTLIQQGQFLFWAGKCHALPPLSLPPFIVTTLCCIYATIVTHAPILHPPYARYDTQRKNM